MAEKPVSESDCNVRSAAASENLSSAGFQRFYQIFNASPNGLLLVNHQGVIVESNSQAQEWFQYSRSELVSFPVEQLVPNRYREEHRALRQGYNLHPESHHMGEKRRVFALRRDGSEFPVDITLTPLELDGEPLVLATVLDSSIYRSSLESMEKLAHSDPLTGLPNRRLFYKRLDALVETGLRKQGAFAVMLVDLDHFKQVNDTLGHGAGDLLLLEVAMRMQARIRELDTLARLGGDEFGIILLGLESASQAASIAQKLLSGLLEPIELEGHEVAISASLGISLCPQDATDTADIVRCADTAMYGAKHAGRNQFLFYADVQNT